MHPRRHHLFRQRRTPPLHSRKTEAPQAGQQKEGAHYLKNLENVPNLRVTDKKRAPLPSVRVVSLVDARPAIAARRSSRVNNVTLRIGLEDESKIYLAYSCGLDGRQLNDEYKEVLGHGPDDLHYYLKIEKIIEAHCRVDDKGNSKRKGDEDIRLFVVVLQFALCCFVKQVSPLDNEHSIFALPIHFLHIVEVACPHWLEVLTIASLLVLGSAQCALRIGTLGRIVVWRCAARPCDDVKIWAWYPWVILELLRVSWHGRSLEVQADTESDKRAIHWPIQSPAS
jgi:hypothetical protein